MKVSTGFGVFLSCSALICAFYPQGVTSQIPTVCADSRSLESMECCPNDCGASMDRGSCTDVPTPPKLSTSEVRDNWPHYYRRVCECTGNYWGIDCSRCKYGYYGPNCENNTVFSRENIKDTNMAEYHKILKMARNTISGYKVVMQEHEPGTPASQLEMTSISIYDLFVWLHHYAAKDNGELCNGSLCTDYAHELTGFPTWHRQFMLWFEWEIQYMLKDVMNASDYYEFRVPYWDWRKEKQSEIEIFQRDMLGTASGQIPLVEGDLFEPDWNTTCWYDGSGKVGKPDNRICDPRVNTGPLYRCPKALNGDDPCRHSNPNWPTLADYRRAIDKSKYDTDSYDEFANKDSFRNFLEGFEEVNTKNECDELPLCLPRDDRYLQRHLHNAVHIIVGNIDLKCKAEYQGVMADVAASPNDPLFINHHSMVDCIFEQWLKKNSSQTYPDDPNIKKGHRSDDYIVPFFPLVKHSKMYKQADTFGYTCQLSTAFLLKPLTWVILAIGGTVSLMSV